MKHIPVMAKEVIELLCPKENETFIDCTLGNGGHALEILERTRPNGILLGIDRDEESVKRARITLAKEVRGRRAILTQGNYADVDEIASRLTIEKADGILLDLGYSSDQLEEGRGFSFLAQDPLDMRYDPATPLKASHIVQYWSRKDLERILKEYGEERCARQIANAIIERRSKKPIESAKDLASIIEQAVPRSYRAQKIHPATRTFQALRIAVNNELENLKTCLPKAIALLKKGGRLGVISFHSLEDRIVKETFRRYAQEQSIELRTKKPLSPTLEERTINPRAGSAKLRVAQKRYSS
ncbi:MAG: 16S rRNA (cytosine(1402)-N(4))-methyltransferase RsmH [Candidatus Wildermuthbacteria bacterium]|nr:16S rRNA (cytosine(1402)-N(4))-methyltransferase RsmH [Candidatus Wildermuthbacteria bacterium]